MNKFPLTTEGIAQLQEKLYQMDDQNLKQAAVAIADDALAWIADNFEIEVSLFEALRDVSENLWLMFGWSMAACLLSRKPFVIQKCNGRHGTQPEAYVLHIGTSFCVSYGCNNMNRGQLMVAIGDASKK
jgi:hypothetical protein